MDLFRIIIVILITVSFLVELAADLLNMKSMDKSLPDLFKDMFDDEEYKKSISYGKETAKFGIFESSFSFLLLIGFWFLGGFAFFDNISRNIAHQIGYFNSAILSGIVFFCLLIIGQFLLGLPFSLYKTFSIETKYGFNKTSPFTFLLDIFKSALLFILLGLPVLWLVIFLFSNADYYSWLYVWGFLTLFSIVMQFIAPVLIMPLFNKFTPLEEGTLKEKIMNYSEKVKFPVANIFIIDGSKRSSKANAFFTGFGKNKRIALYDTLKEKLSEDEIVAVIAHEAGHYKRKHILKGFAISTFTTGIYCLVLNLFLMKHELQQIFFVDISSVHIGLISFGIVLSPLMTLLSIASNNLSRKHEYEADSFAAETTDNPDSLVSGLKSLSKTNLSNLNPHSFYIALNYSHPPLKSRIEALLKRTK